MRLRVSASPWERGIVGARIGKWLGFSVVLALLPILFNLMYALTYDPATTMSYLFGRGELLLPAVGLSATALGDIILSEQRATIFKVAATVGSILVVACAAFYFANVSGQYARAEEATVGTVVWISIFLYLLAVGSSASALYVAEWGRRDDLD